MKFNILLIILIGIPAIIFVFSFSFVYDYFVYEIPIKSFIVNEENMHIETIPLILLIPALAIVVIIAIYNAELIYNILMYGNIAGPCVCGYQTIYPLEEIWLILHMTKTITVMLNKYK